MKKKWECFLCCKEKDFKTLPYGYLSNSHPLCKACANSVLENENHKHRSRISYHKAIGDISMVADIPIQIGYTNKN